MSGPETTHIPVAVNDLRYLYYALDALIQGPRDDDEIVPLIIAQRTAVALISRALGVESATASRSDLRQLDADLPVPGSVDGNPLLPPRPVVEIEERAAPTAVVYGEFTRLEGFVFLDAATADALVREVGCLLGEVTLGDLRQLVPTLQHVSPPIQLDEDDWPYTSDDHLVDLNEYEDWPPFPPSYSLVVLPEAVIEELIEHAWVEWHDPMFDGESFVVPLDREADMLAVLARHGISARRDDALIAGLE